MKRKHDRRRLPAGAAAFVALSLLAASWIVFPAAAAFGADSSQTAVSADGVEIAYAAAGKGSPALVFVHGWCFDGSYWKNQVSEFSKSFTVVTVDLAGHGASGRGRKDWTVEAFGKDVAAAVEKLGLGRVILIGHSMGGAVIVEAAKLMPDRVAALVGVDTYQDLGRRIPEAAVEQFLAAFEADYAGTAKGFVKQMFHPGADSILVDSVAARVLAAPQNIAVGVLGSVLRYKQDEAVAGLKIPVYAVNGDLYPTNVEAAKLRTSSFEVRIVAGCGHFPMLEKPEEFNELLGETIAEIVKK